MIMPSVASAIRISITVRLFRSFEVSRIHNLFIYWQSGYKDCLLVESAPRSQLMKVVSLLSGIALIIMALLGAGCETAATAKNAEFVKTVNFSNLDSFHYENTLIVGMEFRESEKFLLEDLSEQVLSDEMSARGFENREGAGDFFVVAKWRKAASVYVNAFDPIDGPHATFNRSRENSSLARISLVLEVYEASSGNLFWRKDMSNAFDAIQLTEDRATRTLQKAVENFPERIEKDPTLQNIQ